MDLINRRAAIDGADAIIARDTSGNNDVVKAMTAWKSYVEALPSAQPERKNGHWIIDGHHIKCNQCGESMCNTDREGDAIPRNFCPNCGAEMREETGGTK